MKGLSRAARRRRQRALEAEVKRRHPDDPPKDGVKPPEEAVVDLIRAIGERTPARSVEFGEDADDPRRWWAKAVLGSGRVRMAEVTVDDPRLGPVEALAELGRELGLRIRIREPIYYDLDAGKVRPPGEEPPR